MNSEKELEKKVVSIHIKMADAQYGRPRSRL